jgi:hypothetical protein
MYLSTAHFTGDGWEAGEVFLRALLYTEDVLEKTHCVDVVNAAPAGLITFPLADLYSMNADGIALLCSYRVPAVPGPAGQTVPNWLALPDAEDIACSAHCTGCAGMRANGRLLAQLRLGDMLLLSLSDIGWRAFFANGIPSASKATVYHLR